MYIRQATPETYREVLKDIRQKEIYKLIVDTNSQHMSKFFRAVSMDTRRANEMVHLAHENTTSNSFPPEPGDDLSI